MTNPNFGGYATKYGVLCTDGRTIVANAFAHEDKKQVPLLWRHDERTPENVLGHVILEHRDGDGVYAHAYFNKSTRGNHARETVEHGDLDSLSIKAIRLRQNGTDVTGGTLTEVSLVPVGANHDARIDSVFIEHGDDLYEKEDEGIIMTGLRLELAHEDAPQDQESSGKTVKEVFETFTPDQQAVVALLIERAVEDQLAQADLDDPDNLTHEGAPVSRNVFDQTDADKPQGIVLTHEQQTEIINYAKENKISLRDAVLQHADPYGITNIQDLFPNPTKVRNTPDWIKRDDSWVAGVLSGVHSTPFANIKSMSADITHDEARARGYIKGDVKAKQFFEVKSRTTSAKTIYKMQMFDRDDLIDVTDFDVVAWVREEMRWMLQEEIARAILFGDNRLTTDPYKVDETKIRPIATDDDFYTAKVMINTGTAAKTLAKQILRSRKLIKGGTGRPTLFTTSDLVVDLLLMEDKLGRRYYDTEAALAAGLGVANIVTCEVLDNGAYKDEDGNILLGVLVNLADYTMGADKGGATAMFDDFDIDYNQFKYLIETRRSGALTKHRSAISLWETAGIEVVPTSPSRDGNAVTVPSTVGIDWTYSINGADPVAAAAGATVTLTAVNTPIEFLADPASGYRFPFNSTTEWTFAYTP